MSLQSFGLAPEALQLQSFRTRKLCNGNAWGYIIKKKYIIYSFYKTTLKDCHCKATSAEALQLQSFNCPAEALQAHGTGQICRMYRIWWPSGLQSLKGIAL